MDHVYAAHGLHTVVGIVKWSLMPVYTILRILLDVAGHKVCLLESELGSMRDTSAFRESAATLSLSLHMKPHRLMINVLWFKILQLKGLL